MRALHLTAFLCPFALAALAAALPACDGSSTGTTTSTTSAGGGGTGGTGGTGGSAPAQPFAPQGCQFKVAPRPEYIDFAPGKDVVGPSPNIRRVRLGLGGNTAVGAAGRADPATSAGFAWQTDDGTLASDITWGDSPDPSTWPAENRAKGVSWLTPAGTINPNGDARMHEVYVCGLSPATTYYYRVGGGPQGAEVWSDVYRFTTTPTDPSAAITIALAGDSRGQDNEAWRLFQKRATLAGATFEMFSGDTINLAPDQGEWEKWLDLAWKDADGNLSTLGQLLTVHAHGNHENHTTLFYGNMVLPQDVDNHPEYAELFFSFDVGPVHVVVLDDFAIGSPGLDPAYAGVLGAWLDADLSAANENRSKVPWILAMHHHGSLSSSSHGEDGDVLDIRKFLMPIWDKHHVDLVVAGHDHNYERSKPVTGPAESPTVVEAGQGTMYLLCAGVGADAYGSGTNAWTEVSRDYTSGAFAGFYSFLKVTQTELKIEGYELHVDGSDVMFDTVTLTK